MFWTELTFLKRLIKCRFDTPLNLREESNYSIRALFYDVEKFGGRTTDGRTGGRRTGGRAGWAGERARVRPRGQAGGRAV